MTLNLLELTIYVSFIALGCWLIISSCFDMPDFEHLFILNFLGLFDFIWST